MAKYLKDTKEGQVILIWIDKDGHVALNNSRPGTKSLDGVSMIPATVIDNSTGFGTTLGWKKGELVPLSHVPNMPVPTSWLTKGILVSQCYNVLVEYLDPMIKDAIRQEQPCKICKRKNDVGVFSCWWCGTGHPTMLTIK